MKEHTPRLVTGKPQHSSPQHQSRLVSKSARGIGRTGDVHGGNPVHAATGADTWSGTTDSGHYVLTNAASDETLTALFDGYARSSGLLAQ